MADAFKCDRCGELAEGSPNERPCIATRDDDARFEWIDGSPLYNAELCDACSRQYRDMIDEFLNPTGERDE